MISPTQRLLPDNTEHTEEKDSHATGGIRTRKTQQGSRRETTH
jgi:hypothetical protein